jgi:hypothetical protein
VRIGGRFPVLVLPGISLADEPPPTVGRALISLALGLLVRGLVALGVEADSFPRVSWDGRRAGRSRTSRPPADSAGTRGLSETESGSNSADP